MVKGWEGLWEVPGSSPTRDKNLPIKKNLPCKLLKKNGAIYELQVRHPSSTPSY